MDSFCGEVAILMRIWCGVAVLAEFVRFLDRGDVDCGRH